MKETEKPDLSQYKTYTLKARLKLDSFEDKENGRKIEFAACELIDPFNDPDFPTVNILPRWDNDSVVFKYQALKALRTSDDITFNVELSVKSYKSKRTGKWVLYPALEAVSPFNNRTYEFRVVASEKSKKNRILFDYLARDLLGLPDYYDDSQRSETADDAGLLP